MAIFALMVSFVIVKPSLEDREMISAECREKEFKEDLKRLLEKHGATMTITDDGVAYDMSVPIVTISMESVWRNGDLIEDFSEFDIRDMDI